jgi:16S rRNA (cytosine1402-N4)-methyltransferase|tara:strand:- start:48 stop:959 length:912 start_codon:yes stop_codon:yes gene_type:complete
MNTNIHQPVMLNEILDVINFNECNFFLDGTYGGGGHSDEFLSRGCEVLALDNYVESEKLAIKKMNFEKNFLFYKSNFKDIDQVVSKNNIKKKFDGVLLDLGFSSNQLLDDNIGLSFKNDVDLNMNYADYDVSAYDILNSYSESELTKIFYEYGEIPKAKKLSNFIIQSRKIKEIKSTFDFIEILRKSCVNFGSNKINFATKPFQAIRIEANKELQNLEVFLSKINNFLNKNALIFIISFHSLEDRIVKNAFKKDTIHKDLSFKDGQIWGYEILTKRPIIASKEELQINPRSRSAKLRIVRYKC